MTVEPTRALVAAPGDPQRASTELSTAVLAHAWQLHHVLSSLNRLEVRGRDSAGIAVYVRFPSNAALDNFLDHKKRKLVEERSQNATLTHGSAVRPTNADDTLLFVFKVAREIGRMGDNVAFLRQAIIHDPLFQAAMRVFNVSIQCLAHTRWASNGIISESNCHPVDSATYAHTGSPDDSSSQATVAGCGEIVAVLNGDVDNYQALLNTYREQHGIDTDERITTDAKLIPMAVHHHYQATGDLVEAFRRAFDEFQGSMAIGVMAADRPGEFVFGQKGSGQGLFFGITTEAVAIASEMYGIVEFSPDYVKALGESVDGGEIFHLDGRAAGEISINRFDRNSSEPLLAARQCKAEITTRDINRGEFSHFLSKEIFESVHTVNKTLRGKFEVSTGKVRSLLGEEVLPRDMLAALKSRAVRRIFVVGQGTAAVAGQGVAHLLQGALGAIQPSFEIRAMKATELSAHHMCADMSDSVVIAISQSGTTTDTNCTVDMAREHGAHVIGIVNRRNSDLVYKSHGVLYTSDGRDIEMSVASTKAFYAQNVAGQVLALALALELDASSTEAIADEIRSLEQLPDAMAAVLQKNDAIGELAENLALRRRHWALVGSGSGKIAADEIRIKLSELCYKSIASDFLEDKKHIDLSSEPLVIVCANATSESTISDLVKEVAIFKAHSSIPIVITDEGETRFDPYAAGIVKVPRYDGQLHYLLATMVGHLFGYHAAANFDQQAERLRRLRAEIVKLTGGDPTVSSPNVLLNSLGADTTRELLEIEDTLSNGELNSGLEASTAVRLAEAIGFLLGRISADSLSRRHPSFIEATLAHLSDAIAELTRPIDAIKHQAKTVTVGVSRTEELVREGVLWETLRQFQVDETLLAESHRRFLSAFSPLVHSVDGVSAYRIENLDPRGRPTDTSKIQILEKRGCTRSFLSRCEQPEPLSGTKWGVVMRRELFLGYGQTDNRIILIIPVVSEATSGGLLLFHLELVEFGHPEVRYRALQGLEGHLQRLRIAVTERNLAWDQSRLSQVDNETLFLSRPDDIAEKILQKSAVKSE